MARDTLTIDGVLAAVETTTLPTLYKATLGKSGRAKFGKFKLVK